jgi:hypothetical protein
MFDENINIEETTNQAIIKKKINIKKERPNILLSYNEYIKDQNIKKYKIPELKSIAKNLRLFITGSKQVLIERIKTHFDKFSKSIIIQKIFRGFIVRKSFQLRGDAFKNRSLCINNTDFYTLEPLSNIPLESFFSYKGEGDFIYGFDINSVISLIKNNNQTKLINPYNRENMTTIVGSINTLIKINNIIRKKQTESSLNYILNVINTKNYNLNDAAEELRKAKLKPLDQRINDLFVEIDQLGNYTQSEWFSQLNRPDIVRYFRCIYDIWNYRAQLSIETKRKICPLRDPFGNIYHSLSQLLNLSDDQLKMLCLSVMEQMILTGIDKDHKMLGTFHVLTALTVVSGPARANLPWLFESLGF